MARLPDVSSRYGAPMGRVETLPPTASRLSLRRVRINQGGYDSGGTYWGLGAPLYWASDDAGTVDSYVRARTREGAKAAVRAQFPAAEFLR